MRYIAKIFLVFILALIMVYPLCNAKAASNRYGSIIKLWDNIQINKDETVGGDVVSIFGNIDVDGDVSGSVVSIFGNITVNGKVLGDAVAVFGSINTNDSGKVLGNTVEALGGRYEGINHNYIYKYNYRPGFYMNPFGKFAGSVITLMITTGLFLIAALVYLIMPVRLREMADTIEQNMGKRFGIGLLALVCSPIAMVLLTIVLAITIIGMIVIPFAWIAYLIAGFVAMIPVYIYAGLKIGHLASNKSITTFGALTVGVYSIWLVQTVISLGGGFTTWINMLISFAIFLLGTGTLIDYVIVNRKKKIYS